ncbi:hypothetical protein JCM3770_007390 [Rhodotorula araucariae]
MKSFVALSAAALLASSVAAHGPSGQRQALHRRSADRLHRRTKPLLAVTPSSENSTTAAKGADVTSTTAIWWAEAGWVGACGVTIDNDASYVGLPLSLYPTPSDKSSLCGTKAYATNPATGASVTVTVVDASNRGDFTTFSKAAYLALGGDADVGMLPISLSLSEEAVAAVAADASASVAASASSAASHPASSKLAGAFSSADVKAALAASAASNAASTAAPVTTTAAPVSSHAAPTSTFDSASAAAASKAAASAAAADAASSSKAAAKVYQSEQAQILAASQAAAAQSSSAAAAAASSKAAAQAAASQKAAADAAASSSAAAAAASSKAAADAAASSAAAASSKAAAASASAAAAAAAKQESSPPASSGGRVYTGGYATYYTQNGVAGNCGDVNPDSAYIVALPTATYSGGSHCGRKVSITRSSTGKTITAVVADSCPTCVNNSCLDLSVAAFTALATEEEGMVPITWSFI